MGIWDKIRGEFIDIIEWLDPSQDTMVYRFERHQNEIKHGAKLTVRESQVAVFVNEGQIADIFPPGMYTLETQNLPILATLQGWKYGFNSPFKAEVYFVNTKRITDLKWGTKNPILMRDPDFGMVRVRAFGTYAMRVKDAGKFLKEIAGTDWQFTTDEITENIRNNVVSQFADVLGESKIPVLDLAAKYDDMGGFLREKIQPGLDEIGIELLNLLVENVSVPPEVEAAIDTRAKMGAIGDMSRYQQFQAAESMTLAAQNPGGAGAIGAQMAAGMAMGQQMAAAMAPPVQPAAVPAPPAAVPPPVPQAKPFFLVQNGAQAGPFDPATLRAMAGDGRLTRDTLAWCEGMAAWAKAGEVDELSAIFGSVPPPVPPAQ